MFVVCGETIENELDPNIFAPFLGLEKPPEETLLMSSPGKEGFITSLLPLPPGPSQSPPKQIQQNKRESKAIRQSRRLSSKGMVETTPLLRGGMYENLYFFNQQSYFGKDGVTTTRRDDFSILSSTPQVIAEQWTLVEHFLYSKVKRSDFLEKDDAPGSNLLQLKQFQWHMMDWCISQIIDSTSIDDSQLKITFFLEVATFMEGYRNFNGMFEIYTVLHTTSVFRLKDAWATLKKHAKERNSTLQVLFSTTDSFANYRECVRLLTLGGDWHDKPTMPYLGLYLKDLVHLKQLPTRSTSPGKQDLVNMTKMTSLSSKLLDLHAFQHVAYRFSPDFPMISHLFSSPALKTEEEQYQGSVKLSPL